jgi:hypothetical protein
MNLVQRSVLVVAAIWICRMAETLVSPGRAQEAVPLPALGLVVLIMLASVLLLGGPAPAPVSDRFPSRHRLAVRWLNVVTAVGLTALMIPAVVIGVRTGTLPSVHGWMLVVGNLATGAGLAAAFLAARRAPGDEDGRRDEHTRWQASLRVLCAFFGITAGLRAWHGLQVCLASERHAGCPEFVVPAIVCIALLAVAWRVGAPPRAARATGS